MTSAEIIDICRQGVWVLLKVCGPILILSLLVGFTISLFQALTQMQEMTLSFVPKIILIFISLLFLGPYMLTTLKDFTEQLMNLIVQSG